ncbi:MAG: response regulator transcription factor [Polyangiales bacterium]
MSEPMAKILLVEDDPALALGLVDTLEFEGFQVIHATEGRSAVDLSATSRPDCIILDLMLPDMNGYQVCERVRRENARVPILMLTARSQEADKVRGLESGADDYVTKPFSLNELVARVRALLRRAGQGVVADVPMAVGDSVVDPTAQEVRREGVTEALSHHEVELVKLLWSRQGQAVTREEILERVWGVHADSTTRTVDNVIVKLRKKIEKTPDKPKHILTVYGVGYKLIA